MYTWLDQPVKIYTGKGLIWGLARGEVQIVMAIGKVIVGGVLLVPDLDVDADLLSVTALMTKGFSVTFAEGKADIHKDKKVRGTASSADNGEGSGGGLLYLQEYENVQHYALATSCIDTQTLDTWHKRLAHIQQRTIKDMIPKVTGLCIGEPTKIGERNINCPDSLKGYQHQQISRYPFQPATRPLERVSCDIAGKMRYPDYTWNYQHLVVFINHYTRYVWVFPVSKRDMALRALEIIKTSAENQCGNKLLVLQMDNAAEFMGKKWTKLCQDNGIEHITTQPYAPSMNSYVERVIRTIVEHASTMLWTAGINEDFWALTCKSSAYLLNRSPHSLLDVTPYEMWHGKKPHVGHIRICGCRAYAAIPKEKRTKFESKSKDCILVGFYDVQNLYQLWDIEGKQLIKRRDVIFHENTMGHPDIARVRIPIGTLITGQDKGAEEMADSLEQLYPVIDALKPEEWRDIPATHLTNLPTTLLDWTDRETITNLPTTLLDLTDRERIPKTYQEVVSSKMAIHWIEACQIEHTAMITNNVYTWAELPTTSNSIIPLPSKWLFVIKRRVDRSIDKFKARIVAGGHR